MAQATFSPMMWGHRENVIFEDGVRIWHPETVKLGDNIYIGHDAMLKIITKDTFTSATTRGSAGVFMHGAGGIDIGERVGVGRV